MKAACTGVELLEAFATISDGMLPAVWGASTLDAQ